MGQAADYFKREQYITRRLSLLVLAGTLSLIAVTLLIGRGRIPPMAFPWAIAGVVACVVVAVVLILRAANAKFPRSATPDDLHLDPPTQRKLRRRIVFLDVMVAIYAFILFSSLLHAHRGEWPGLLCATVVILLMESALIKAIRRLKAKLRAGMPAKSGAGAA
jgi:hypothetical protein